MGTAQTRLCPPYEIRNFFGNLFPSAASNPNTLLLVDIMRQAHIPQIAPVESGDTELVRRALARDETAVRAIMQANNRRLYRLARGILRNDGEAEDVVQEAYVRAFTHLESFRGDFSLSTWLSRIAMNEALGRLRRRRPAVELDALPQGALEAEIIQFPLSAAADPEKSMAQREIQAVVEHAIDELPEAFRLVFITRVIEGMNVEETAEILSLKPETVKSRLHRARTYAARQRREEDRPGGDGGVSLCRQALRAADGRRAEAAGFRLTFPGTSGHLHDHPTPVHQQRAALVSAPQECQTCSFE